MKIKTEKYVCSICGRRNVKLWRPYMDTAPLICAECAEKRQTPHEYEETKWQKEENGWYTGKFTGKKLPLPEWKVDENGQVPSYTGPGPDGVPACMTDKLIVDLSDVSTSYSSGSTSMVPACPDEDGDFWCYTSVPEEFCKWWNELPTR